MTVRIPSLDECRYPTRVPLEHFQPRLRIGIYNTLKRAGIHYTEQVAELTPQELALIPGSDARMVDDLIDSLAASGYKLRDH